MVSSRVTLTSYQVDKLRHTWQQCLCVDISHNAAHSGWGRQAVDRVIGWWCILLARVKVAAGEFGASATDDKGKEARFVVTKECSS